MVESGSVEWCEGWCGWWRVARLSGVKVGVGGGELLTG